MGKKRNKNRRDKRSKQQKSNRTLVTEDSPEYNAYLDDPIALLQDGEYELLMEWEARRDGYESAEAMLEAQNQAFAAQVNEPAIRDARAKGNDPARDAEDDDDFEIPF